MRQSVTLHEMPTLPQAEPTDAELIGADFPALFDRHALPIHRFIARRVGTHLADDILGETFLIASDGSFIGTKTVSVAPSAVYALPTGTVVSHTAVTYGVQSKPSIP